MLQGQMENDLPQNKCMVTMERTKSLGAKLVNHMTTDTLTQSVRLTAILHLTYFLKDDKDKGDCDLFIICNIPAVNINNDAFVLIAKPSRIPQVNVL